jgi:hypothetical protein
VVHAWPRNASYDRHHVFLTPFLAPIASAPNWLGVVGDGGGEDGGSAALAESPSDLQNDLSSSLSPHWPGLNAVVDDIFGY